MKLAYALLAACSTQTAVVAPVPTPKPTAVVQPRACSGVRGEKLPLHDGHGFGSHRREKGDICEVADDNLARAEELILSLPAPTASSTTKAGAPDLSLVAQRFDLTAAERSHLAKDGFVVAARLEQPSYGWAYHEIYQSQLPLFVSVDSILDAVYATHDHLLERREREELFPALTALIAQLHCGLAAQSYPPEVAHDLDLYLTVARRLLENRNVPSVIARVDNEAAQVMNHREMAAVDVMGRQRMVDFSQLQPRGHYTEDLAPYFRGAMWLMRFEWNLVSRSSQSSSPRTDPSETPREELDALALSDLIYATGTAAQLDRIEQTLDAFAGTREDVSMAQLHTFGIDVRDPDAATKLRAAIGDKFQRKARIHYMPEGSASLPAIATLLGPRIVPDAIAIRPIVHGETPGRQRVRGGDLAFVAGNERGKRYTDVDRFKTLATQLDKARSLVAEIHSADAYGGWLDAIRALAITPAGTLPTFMHTDAYADLRLDTTIAAIAQLAHNHVLLAGQAYGEGGCEIPDAYVEPAPEVYEAIGRYAARLGQQRVVQIMRVLAAISRIELANQPLPEAAKHWLGMITEILPYGSDGRPTYTGWYFDLFDDRSDAIAHADLVADVFTSGEGPVSYLGVKAPSLGIFIVDTGGKPRPMVGPIAHAYEHVANEKRLTDESARSVTGDSPWTASYRLPAPPEPSFRATVGRDYDEKTQQETEWGVTFTAKKRLGKVELQPVDHHRVPIGKPVTRDVGVGKTFIQLPVSDLTRIKIGAWETWIEPGCMDGCRNVGFGADRDTIPEE